MTTIPSHPHRPRRSSRSSRSSRPAAARPAVSGPSRPPPRPRRPSPPAPTSRRARAPAPARPTTRADPSEEPSEASTAPTTRAQPTPAHDRDDDRPGLLRPRRRTRQRRSRAGAPGGAEVDGRRQGRDDGPPRRSDRSRIRRSPDLDRHPRRHDASRRQRQERRRDGRPLDRVRLGRRLGLDAVPAGPGGLHADPVQRPSSRSCSRSTARP